MARLEYNENPMSLREGRIAIDGSVIADLVSASFQFTPTVWTGTEVGKLTTSSKWLAYAITGTITERRSNPWLINTIKQYKNSRVTPEFTIQGIMNDVSSDYVNDYGNDTVTLVGCVLSGNIPLTALDTNGEVVEDPINFNAVDVL